jgi:3-deoxy-D-manno-octulosonic acid kinase
VGVIHPDLNVKNILLARNARGELDAMMIDVDTIAWDEHRAQRATMQANVARLTRSMRKWRRQFGCDITDHDLDKFTRVAMSATPERIPI